MTTIDEALAQLTAEIAEVRQRLSDAVVLPGGGPGEPAIVTSRGNGALVASATDATAACRWVPA